MPRATGPRGTKCALESVAIIGPHALLGEVGSGLHNLASTYFVYSDHLSSKRRK